MTSALGGKGPCWLTTSAPTTLPHRRCRAMNLTAFNIVRRAAGLNHAVVLEPLDGASRGLVAPAQLVI